LGLRIVTLGLRILTLGLRFSQLELENVSCKIHVKFDFEELYEEFFFLTFLIFSSVVCGLVVRVPGYRSRDSGSIPGATRFYEK
jgi:hypothetical protein